MLQSWNSTFLILILILLKAGSCRQLRLCRDGMVPRVLQPQGEGARGPAANRGPKCGPKHSPTCVLPSSPTLARCIRCFRSCTANTPESLRRLQGCSKPQHTPTWCPPLPAVTDTRVEPMARTRHPSHPLLPSLRAWPFPSHRFAQQSSELHLCVTPMEPAVPLGWEMVPALPGSQCRNNPGKAPPARTVPSLLNSLQIMAPQFTADAAGLLPLIYRLQRTMRCYGASGETPRNAANWVSAPKP